MRLNMLKPIWLIPICCLIVQAAEKPVAPVKGENDSVDITAAAHVDKAAVAAAIGVDPGINLIVVDVTLRVKGEEEFAVWRDDFVLLSRRDGQRCQPLSPSQIAGQGALVVSSRGPGRGGVGIGNQNRGPIWGGVPGTSDRPRRVGGDDTAVTSGTPAETKTTASEKAQGNETLLDVLKKKVLPETKTKDDVTGQLYFILDGKHRLKDLELLYGSGPQRITLDFVK